MWTPNDATAVFDHCIWTVVQAGMAWVGFIVLLDIVFGGSDESDEG
jgi:hypothetical protein